MDGLGRGAAPGYAGHCQLTEKIGDGYLGPVYRSVDRNSGRTVAVRLLGGVRHLDSAARAVVLAGCRTLTTIYHPNIVSVLEAGEDHELLYVVTEFVEGDTFEPSSAGRRAPLEQKLSLMVQAAEGFAHAHRSGVLHCDFRPTKACVTAHGVLRIRDVGLSRLLPRYQSRPSVKWGEPIYLSPEQIEGSSCTPRSDIFSAGIVFQEFLTGVHPFQGENGHHTLDRILRETPRRFEELLPDAPGGIGRLLRRCLEKQPGDRFGSMTELADGCREIIREMASDAQVMLSDIQESARLLKAAPRKVAVSPALRKLQEDLEMVLNSGDSPGYAALESVTSKLFQHYPQLQEVCGEDASGSPEGTIPPVGQSPVPPDVQDAPPPVTMAVQSASPQFRLSPADRPKGDRPQPVTPETVSVTSGRPALAPAAPRPSNEPLAVPAPSAARARVAGPARRRRPSLTRAAALLAVLLTVVAAYIFVNIGASGTGWLTGGFVPAERPAAGAASPAIPVSSEPRGDGTDVEVLSLDVRTAVLVREAQELSVSGRDVESRQMLKRALEISPGHEKAQALLDLMTPSQESETPAARDPAFGKALAEAAALLDSGDFAAAKIAIDRLQRQYPDDPDVGALRQKWAAKKARLQRDEARREEEKSTAAREQQSREGDWAGRIQSQILEGKYPEARNVLNFWISQDPANPRAQALVNRLAEAEKAFKQCEEALGGNRFQDALAALTTVERLSPSHPQIGELRRRAEQARGNTRGILSVYPLGAGGSVHLDGRPLGSGDEVENESVPAGSHSLSVRGPGAANLSARFDISDGQTASFVYDLEKHLLRPMEDRDREPLKLRRAEGEVHRFSLEHNHGVFRGSCKGELLVSLRQVEFRPATGTHRFQFPFFQLQLRTDSRSIDLIDRIAGSEFGSFKAPDPDKAEQLRKVWDRLQTAARQRAAAGQGETR